MRTTPDPHQPIFRALADPTRRDILIRLKSESPNNGLNIGQIADHYPTTRAAIKKHLTILEQGKLINIRTQGRQRIITLNPTALKKAAHWLNHFDAFWDKKLSQLKTQIDSE